MINELTRPGNLTLQGKNYFIIKLAIMSANIGITEKNTQAIAEILSKLLADEFVIYVKTRNAHWNVEGPDFIDKHKFFESQYEQLDEIMDAVAERIRTIGHYSPATLQSFLELTHLTERRNTLNSSKNFIKDLLEDHETTAVYLRENIGKVADQLGDVGTSDFLTGLLKDHEKMAWFLRSHLA